MEANQLQLNLAKTEILWCASSRRQYLVPTASVRVGDVLVSPVTAARDLGVYIDTDVKDTRLQYRPIVLLGTAPDPECATFSAIARSDNICSLPNWTIAIRSL